MYTLYAIDTIVRITLALVVLFVVVPALAWPRPAALSRMEWFWWNLGAGIALLTLAGQLFTLLNIAGPLSYLVLIAAVIVFGRARAAGVPPLTWIRDSYRASVLFALHVLDGKYGVRRQSRRFQSGSFAAALHNPAVIALGVSALAAAVTRFFRPFATANLGFSDTYAHLYLMRLLDEGKQLDPAWGPYPRGMHFLLLAIERLTNVDPILLMNFFGAFSGILLTLAVADTARRSTRSNAAALIAGVIFATMIGGASQYFALGGSVPARNPATARVLLGQSYDELKMAGEFDVLLTVFQRQTSTLPQELAIVLLFPAALFLLDWLRTKERWRLAGFIACTAAIAAVHSGVLVPLVALCAAAAIAVLATRSANPRDILRGAAAGAIGIAIGSTWMFGFFVHRQPAGGPNVENTARYYFPFLRAAEDEKAYMMVTPLLIAIVVLAVLLAIAGIRMREPHAVWICAGTIFFVLAHAAPALNIPEVIEVRRNASWLAMSVAVLLGAVIAAVALRLPQRVRAALPIVVIAAWCATIPNITASAMRARLLDYSGYGTTTYAVLRISQRLQPFTWTLVSYGQEYPMVLGRGFHLNASDFVEQFDPTEAKLRVPTQHVFIAVEKNPHRFEIDNWSKRFGRAAVEERLQTWCTVYAMTHRNIRVWLDDENVRIYEITAEGKEL